MTKHFISTIALLSILLLHSCKKDANDSNGYYIKMKINNNDFSFNDSLFAAKAPPELTIYGYSKTQGQLGWLFSDFSVGTYLDTYDTSIKKVIYQFTINAIVDYYNNAPVLYTLLRPNPAVSNPISMTITNVNETYVEGTFSGTLSGGPTATTTITNGQFKVPFR
jgi:hypothetical protein